MKDGSPCPTPRQLAFIRAAASRYQYLGLGETLHDVPAIELFALHEKTLGVLAEAGKTSLFVEQRPQRQAYYDALKDNRTPGIFPHNTWLDEAQNLRLRLSFESAARAHPEISFYTADRRASRDICHGFPRDKAQQLIDFLNILITGRFEEANAFRIKADIPDEMAGRFLDGVDKCDQSSAAYIESISNSGVIFYGIEHLKNNPANKNNLRFLLGRSENAICTIAIRERNTGEADPQIDAELYTDPQDGPEGEIKIINPTLQPLYDRAIGDLRL